MESGTFKNCDTPLAKATWLVNTRGSTITDYTRRLCCHSVRPGQAGELGAEEPDEVQQGQMQGPASGEEQPHASVKAWDGPAGSLRRGTWVS